MRHFFVEKVKAIVSNVDYEKATMHVENIDVPYFATLDKWGDFVKELNVVNRADRISGTDLALEMNGGKTAHINKLDIDLDYINDGGEHELPDGELEVSFHLVSKGSIYYLKELWFGDKPVYVTYRATAENIDIDIDIDETEEYDRYDDEFFESVYREANNTIHKIKETHKLIDLDDGSPIVYDNPDEAKKDFPLLKEINDILSKQKGEKIDKALDQLELDSHGLHDLHKFLKEIRHFLSTDDYFSTEGLLTNNDLEKVQDLLGGCLCQVLRVQTILSTLEDLGILTLLYKHFWNKDIFASKVYKHFYTNDI